MPNFPPTEILFFLWCDARATFNLPRGIVSPDPVTYTIEWLGADNFSHTWCGSDPSDINSQEQSLEATMDFVKRNAKYFKILWDKTAIASHLICEWLLAAVGSVEAAFAPTAHCVYRLAGKPVQKPDGHLQNATLGLGS